MNGYRKQNQKGLFSLIVFSLFSFSWLAFFQGHLISYAYDRVISSIGGIVGSCNRFIMAALVTAILDLIARWIHRISKHPSIFSSLEYLIPSVVLGVFTGFDSETLFPQSSLQWILAAILVMLSLIIADVIRYRKNIKTDDSVKVFTINLLILFFDMLIVASLGNTDENLHRRAAMEEYMSRSQYEKALMVGFNEQESDPEIDRLRLQAMYALDADSIGTGLAERMFQYPISDMSLTAAFIENSISSSDDSLMQVYLGNVAALLERDVRHLDSMDLSSYNKVLPQYFMQALILAGSDSIEQYFPDQYMKEKRIFESFENVLESVSDKPAVYRRNATYLDFRRTYYWFYSF